MGSIRPYGQRASRALDPFGPQIAMCYNMCVEVEIGDVQFEIVDNSVIFGRVVAGNDSHYYMLDVKIVKPGHRDLNYHGTTMIAYNDLVPSREAIVRRNWIHPMSHWFGFYDPPNSRFTRVPSADNLSGGSLSLSPLLDVEN